MGSSPSKKYRGATGEYWLNFRKARRTLLWNVVRVFNTGGLIGKAARPDLRTGLQRLTRYVAAQWEIACTCMRIHYQENQTENL